MRSFAALLIGLAFVSSSSAADFEVKIPKEGWSISFDAPPLSEKKQSRHSGDFEFSATSHRFNISLFVEKPRGAGTTNRDCYNYYWSRASQNALIAQETVSFSETERYARIQYDIATSLQGMAFRLTNVHYYFIYRDKWVDVHISMGNPTPEDYQVFKTFDASLRYGP